MQSSVKYRCAGIVLFNPDPERLEKNIKTITPQVDHLIVVDNGSQINEKVELAIPHDDKIIRINNEENMGIAAALNQIAEAAQSLGYEWTLLLDHDSICSTTLMDSYGEVIASENSLGLLTPYIIDINRMSQAEYKKLDLPRLSTVDWAITSGCLINIAIWNKVGRFDEELFIDYVDIDYCIRLQIQGVRQLRVNSEYILHEVGHAEPTWIIRPHKDNAGHWSWKRYYRSNHSVLRQYYITRNSLIVARKYKKHKPFFKGIVFIILMTVPKIFIEKNKRELVLGIFVSVNTSAQIPSVPEGSTQAAWIRSVAIW